MRKLEIIGRVGSDAKLKYFEDGSAVCNFSLASENYKDKEPTWDSCSLFGKRAESLVLYLTKGKQICVDGELRQSRWEQDGQARSKVEVHANNIQLLGGNRDNNANRQGQDNSDLQNNFEDDIPY